MSARAVDCSSRGIGGVAVGGAGNFSRLPKGKQIALPKDIPCVIAAAGILEGYPEIVVHGFDHNVNIAAFGHGLHGVDQDVEKGLVQHVGIGANLR